jgi:hypothetical protein
LFELFSVELGAFTTWSRDKEARRPPLPIEHSKRLKTAKLASFSFRDPHPATTGDREF